jgi:ribosomal protein L15E
VIELQELMKIDIRRNALRLLRPTPLNRRRKDIYRALPLLKKLSVDIPAGSKPRLNRGINPPHASHMGKAIGIADAL